MGLNWRICGLSRRTGPAVAYGRMKETEREPAAEVCT